SPHHHYSRLRARPLLLRHYAAHRDLHSFPTRRSSDLAERQHAPTVLCYGHFDVQPSSIVSSNGSVCQSSSGAGGCTSKWPKQRRSEEHTSELQSRGHLVCRLLLEKKNIQFRGENYIRF